MKMIVSVMTTMQSMQSNQTNLLLKQKTPRVEINYLHDIQLRSKVLMT